MIDKARRKRQFNLIGAGFALFTLVVVFGTPADMLTSHSWASTYVAFVQKIFPSVEVYGKQSTLPEVARFSFAVLWPAYPVLVLAFWLILKGARVEDPPENIATWKLIMLGLSLTLPSVIFAFAFPRLSRSNSIPSDAFERLASSSRLGLAVFACLLILGAAAATTFGSFLLTKVWKTRIAEKGDS